MERAGVAASPRRIRHVGARGWPIHAGLKTGPLGPPSRGPAAKVAGPELALQLLYQLDVQGEGSPGPHLDEFWTRHPVDVDVREFAEALVRGTKLHEAKIDELISQYAQHWELERMAVVDRNILREGIFEILWAGDVPPKVAINEALEVAKKFSTRVSSRFINGILDRVHKELRPPADPACDTRSSPTCTATWKPSRPCWPTRLPR